MSLQFILTCLCAAYALFSFVTLIFFLRRGDSAKATASFLMMLGCIYGAEVSG